MHSDWLKICDFYVWEIFVRDVFGPVSIYGVGVGGAGTVVSWSRTFRVKVRTLDVTRLTFWNYSTSISDIK